MYTMRIENKHDNSINFRAGLLVSGNRDLLTENQIKALERQASYIGRDDDILEIEFKSGIFDFQEVNSKNCPTKYLTGYKAQINSTLDGLDSVDISVARTEQTFWERFEQFNPFVVVKNALEKIGDKNQINQYIATVNDFPQIYNAKNDNWKPNLPVLMREKPVKPEVRGLYESPVYRAVSEKLRGIVPHKPRIAVVDIFDKNGISFNSSNSYDKSHGDLVLALLKQLTEDVEVDIDTYSVKALKNRPVYCEPHSLLKTLKKMPKGYYDYMNLSTAFPWEYKLNGAMFAPELLFENSEALRGEIPRTILHIIEELEKFVQTGCEVYISGGNSSKTFNLLSLARGVHSIGGREDETSLKQFAVNPLIERYEKLPIYISGQEVQNAERLVLRTGEMLPIERDLSKLSRKELLRRVAKEEDYDKLAVWAQKNCPAHGAKMDLNFLNYRMAMDFDKNMRGKIFDLRRYTRIFRDKFSEEIYKYIKPQGTHCDIQFSQFFDLESRNAFIIPHEKTTKIFKSVSGTSFVTPQALVKDLKTDLLARELVFNNDKFYKSLLKFI